MNGARYTVEAHRTHICRPLAKNRHCSFRMYRSEMVSPMNVSNRMDPACEIDYSRSISNGFCILHRGSFVSIVRRIDGPFYGRYWSSATEFSIDSFMFRILRYDKITIISFKDLVNRGCRCCHITSDIQTFMTGMRTQYLFSKMWNDIIYW